MKHIWRNSKFNSTQKWAKECPLCLWMLFVLLISFNFCSCTEGYTCIDARDTGNPSLSGEASLRNGDAIAAQGEGRNTLNGQEAIDFYKEGILAGRYTENFLEEVEQRSIDGKTFFLLRLYRDLYQLPPKNFSYYYKYCFTKVVRNALKQIHKNIHQGEKGYAWFLLGDNKYHCDTTITIKPMKTQEWDTNEWYTVQLDTSVVRVFITGIYPNIEIGGLVNYKYNIGIQ